MQMEDAKVKTLEDNSLKKNIQSKVDLIPKSPEHLIKVDEDKDGNDKMRIEIDKNISELDKSDNKGLKEPGSGLPPRVSPAMIEPTKQATTLSKPIVKSKWDSAVKQETYSMAGASDAKLVELHVKGTRSRDNSNS